MDEKVSIIIAMIWMDVDSGEVSEVKASRMSLWKGAEGKAVGILQHLCNGTADVWPVSDGRVESSGYGYLREGSAIQDVIAGCLLG